MTKTCKSQFIINRGTSSHKKKILTPEIPRSFEFPLGICHGISFDKLPAPSNGWCLNPKGLLNGTLSHPFGTPWKVQVSKSPSIKYHAAAMSKKIWFGSAQVSAVAQVFALPSRWLWQYNHWGSAHPSPIRKPSTSPWNKHGVTMQCHVVGLESKTEKSLFS